MNKLFYICALFFSSCIFNSTFAIEDDVISQLTKELNFTESTTATLHLSDGTDPAHLNTLEFNIPLPPGLLKNAQHLKIFHNNEELSYFSTSHLPWKKMSTNMEHSIRALKIQIKNNNYKFPLKLNIEFNASPTKEIFSNAIENNLFIMKNITLDKKGKTKNIPIKVPITYATFNPDWLGTCLLRSLSLPINKNTRLKWFDDKFIRNSEAYLNNKLSALHPKGNISLLDFEPWMFDLSSTFFNAYIKTGELKWLKHAHLTSQIYSYHLNEHGQSTFREHLDLKHSYNLSMLLSNILIGDNSTISKIEDIASYTSKWKRDYKFNNGFWTERHQAYSLLGSLVAWEATGKKLHLNNAKLIADATINEALNPEAGWEPQGCVLHALGAHEGYKDDRPACSPWMSALLSEAMFRYYLQSGDNKALSFIYNLAMFTAKYGTYQVTDDYHLKGQHVPWYLAEKNLGYTDNGPWDDRQHACDVSGLLARGVWAGNSLGKTLGNIISVTKNLLHTCEKSLDSKIKPHRKFNWLYGSTSDLTYFYQTNDF